MEKSIEQFKSECRQKGLKVTSQRWTVYKTLYSMMGHPSVEEVYEEVAKQLPTISLNTVYLSLEWLEQNGFASSVSLKTSKKKYDTFSEPHHHLVCVSCGLVTDLERPEDSDLVPPEVRKQYKVLDFDLTVQVLCGDCSKSQSLKARRSA